ncbi:MAG: ATPase [Bacteroidetes bacterium]|nr:ATPase [Bacteroidota bacterium]MCB0537090.1 ATPase [Bacteroidota bacterium]
MELKKLTVILYLVTVGILIADYGFNFPALFQKIILAFYFFVLVIGILLTAIQIAQYLLGIKKFVLNTFVYDIISLLFVLFCIQKQISIYSFEIASDWLRWAIIVKLIREFAVPKFNYKRSFLNPAQLFIISFLGLILLGTLFLLLPNSTYQGISFIDALFTSTSAVCVTGLIVVDTSSYFTQFGQTIIMLLIQAGGLGILTFASYFSYFFKGGSTYENQLALSDLSDNRKLGEVFTTLKRILIITFLVESIGAFFIYININSSVIPAFWDRIYFSVFHSISAFCNAGFSTLPNGIMQEGFEFNYPLQLVLIGIFVFGGLGFPIVINILRYFKHLIKRYALWFISGKSSYKPWIMTLSNKINLITTFTLVIIGTIILFIKEYDNVLSTHHGFGKFVTALFTATTPRTAGFNSIDFSHLHYSSIIIIILLMWIGASPASTGGGIKTSTFAIATLNFFSLAKGKSRIEIFRREIADISVRRAFATLSLSLIVIGFGVILITHFDSHIPLLDTAFECFSAYSTVGLSLGITADLSTTSKLVLIGIMFIGRVSMLSILIAFMKKAKPLTYQYPTDEILIN